MLLVLGAVGELVLDSVPGGVLVGVVLVLVGVVLVLVGVVLVLVGVVLVLVLVVAAVGEPALDSVPGGVLVSTGIGPVVVGAVFALAGAVPLSDWPVPG